MIFFSYWKWNFYEFCKNLLQKTQATLTDSLNLSIISCFLGKNKA